METCCSRFTAAEGGARLAAVACMKNTLTVEYSSFIATRLVYEEAYKIRGPLSEGRQRSVHVTKPHRVPYIAYELNILTDLSVSQSVKYEDEFDWSAELEAKEVLVCTSNVLKQILTDGILRMVDINVLVIESCHMISVDEDLQYIMDVYKRCDEDQRPRILGLTYPLFTAPQKKPETIDENNKEVDKKDDGDEAESNDQANVPRKPANPIGVYENRDDFAMYEKLEWKIEELESALCCQMDLAEDIDGGKRLSSFIAKPKELIIQYSQHKSPSDLTEDYVELVQFMRETVNDALQFIEEHRYDPTEIYGEDMYEEFKTIPDPTVEPRRMFQLFLYILDELGPYGADKAAFSLLVKLEKLKIKVPYERHFLLLCLCTTIFVKIRCYADNVFTKYTTDWDKIKLFCTPKVLRLAEILEKFQPKDSVNKVEDEAKKSTSVMLDAIDKCDFKSLGDKIEDRVNEIETGLKDLYVDTNEVSQSNVIELDKSPSEQNETEKSLHESIKSQHESEKSSPDTEKSLHDIEKSLPDSNSNNPVESNNQRGILGFPRRGNRTRGKGRIQRNNANRVQQMMQNPDALCGIVFMNDPLMAKIVFMIVADMSRSNSKLSYISAQYCCVERASVEEPAECQRQGKKHEDVLKKFRMHECNLLLATSALEEGIDLPRCNLVLRWDLPPNYRSYGLCRGRARSSRAASALLCAHAGVVQHQATYTTLDRIISKKCGCGIQDEPPQSEEDHADTFTTIVQPYTASTCDGQTDKHDGDDDEADDKADDENEALCEGVNGDFKVDDEIESDKDADFVIVDSETERKSEIGDMEVANIEANNCDVNDKSCSETVKLSKRDVESSKTASELSKDTAELIKNTARLGKELEELIDTAESTKDISECENGAKFNERKQCDSKNNDLDSKVNTERKTDVLKDFRDKNNEINRDICYKVDNKNGEFASVDLSTAIALINRYCGKLPSDTFTRLAPQWWMERVQIPVGDEKKEAFICTIRLPLNCPVKYNIVGHPMPTRVLAKRMVALQACRILHKSGELDNQLMPIGKENFKPDVEASSQGATDSIGASDDVARPGTNKRRQYYYKRTALAFTDCEPVIDTTDEDLFPNEDDRIPMENPMNIKKDNKRNMLYAIISHLWCALPERYNTRGRNLHAPENASQAVAVLMARRGDSCLRIPAFPVYTRSGEVRVSVSYEPKADVRMSPTRAALVHRFMQFVFASVLRVRRRGMRLHTHTHTHNNYYIVPTVKVNCDDGTTYTNIDWNFLRLIYLHTEQQKLSEIEKPLNEQENDDKEDTGVDKRKSEAETERLGNETHDKDKIHNNENEHKPQNEDRDNLTQNSEDKTGNNDNIKQDNPDKQQDNKIETEVIENKLQINSEIHNKTEDIEKQKDTLKDKTNNTNFKATDVKKYNNKDRKDQVKKIDNPLLKKGEVFVFNADKYMEAVVTPWYRNQDQPQFFLVAEICWNLSPDSEFPSATHESFRHYYQSKYGVELTQTKQPLLDVDHTSARLNLLTPRYVNRKGVALPVSSERTRRAKRDRLDQKQILVPELCRVHPFAAPLWFATVALPCVLYRINALLIADEIRRSVALDVGLGIPRIDDTNFEWPPLDFGWSLSEVLSADSEKNEKKKGGVNEIQNETGNSLEDSENQETGTDQQHGRGDDKEKTINEILQEKIDAENECFEIGTWSNEMASSIPQDDYDEMLEPLPPNLTFCTSVSGGSNWCDPVEKPKSKFNPTKTFSMADSDCSYMSSDFDTDDSDLNSIGSEDETDTSGYGSKNSNAAMGVRIEYKTSHEAEAVDLEAKKKTKPSPELDMEEEGEDCRRFCEFIVKGTPPDEYIEKFRKSVAEHEEEITKNGFIKHDEPIQEILPENKDNKKLTASYQNDTSTKINELFPYMEINGDITLENIEKCKRKIISRLKNSLTDDEANKLNCFSMKDVDIDSPDFVNEKTANIGFDCIEKYERIMSGCESEFRPYYMENKVQSGKEFDFDYQPDLEGHPGPSPSVILQALTMSNANDGINLERLETIGDSFLKFAITAYLYCARPTVHEGKLSHMRSKQVSNLNLYRLGRNKRLGTLMIASKFEPHDNWLPPCHVPPPTLHPRMTDSKDDLELECEPPVDNTGCFIPYNLITQHSIPDKSIADCVEALIGAYLLECGARGALLFMSWLGIKVLPRHHVKLQRRDVSGEIPSTQNDVTVPQDLTYESVKRPVGSLPPCLIDGEWVQPIFGELRAPPSPLLRYIADPEGELEQMLSGYDELERTLQYRFKDRSLLLQAMTHASHQKNRLTDCYQRLEFLGDAILDYLITRHLYEDPRRHSPGALTDLRSALVNNTIFATLAARHGFHKYFRHMSPGLNEVLTKYVKIQEENGHSISEEHYLIQEDEMEQAEDVEVPKALGDLFESVAGAIFLDSGMSLGAVWKSYVRLMGAELEAFSAAAPKSPVRELLEAEPDTAKFGKPSRLADGRRVRVCVEVFGRGVYRGVGRNYRIAKCTAARAALRHLRAGRR